MKELPEFTIQFFEEYHTTLDYDFDEERNYYFENRALKDSKTGNSRVRVAMTRDMQLVGFFTLSMKSKHFIYKGEKKTWSLALLGQLAVNKPFRRLGIASYLVRKAIEISKEANEYYVACSGVVADVYGIGLVEGLYKKLGFEVVHHDEKKDLYWVFYPFSKDK